MKKFKSILVLLSISLFTNAQQPVFEGDNLHQFESKKSYYILNNQDEKELNATIKDFFRNYGNVSEVSKNSFRIEKLKTGSVSEDLAYIDIRVESNKMLSKVIFFFLNDRENSLESFQLNRNKAISFLGEFNDFNQSKVNLKLANADVKFNDEKVYDAQKVIKKLEKQLENNLKEQEKLGKKLDSSPELLTKALSEKEEIVGKLYNENEEIDPKLENDLKKASDQKEKEIVKINKEKEKALTKLEKKENEFEQLKNDLFRAKSILKHSEIILDSSKENLKSLELPKKGRF